LTTEPEAAAEEEPEIEWQPVSKWPPRAAVLIKDIEAIGHVISLMEGTADQQTPQVFIEFLRAGRLAEQQELALLVLDAHEVRLPDPETMVTPQQQMSNQLKNLADTVRQRRADIVPEKQPYTEKRRGRPGMAPQA
jgi:hypothetical protein